MNAIAMPGILLPYISDDVCKNNLVRVYNSKKILTKVLFHVTENILPLVINALTREIAPTQPDYLVISL